MEKYEDNHIAACFIDTPSCLFVSLVNFVSEAYHMNKYLYFDIFISGENTEQEFKIQKIIKHPDYDANHIDNDIALLKLDRPAMITPHVKLACLPDQGEHVGAGEKYSSSLIVK